MFIKARCCAFLLLGNAPMIHAELVGWGSKAQGQATVPTAATDAVAVAVGTWHTLALRADGTVVAWGDNRSGQTNVPAGLANVRALAAGEAHSLALRWDGTVACWGRDEFTQATVPSGLTNVAAIAARGHHSLALRADGTVVAWGDNARGESDVPAGLTGCTAIAAGAAHSFALLGNGTVIAWGENQDGQTRVPADLTDVVAIAAGNAHSLALTRSGKVIGWGNGWSGQLMTPGNASPVVALSAGGYHTLALLMDGNLVAWGANWAGQTSVPSGLRGSGIMAAGEDASFSVRNPLPAQPPSTLTPPTGLIYTAYPVTHVISRTLLDEVITSSGLPMGMSFDAATGNISGTPSQGGYFAVRMKRTFPTGVESGFYFTLPVLDPAWTTAFHNWQAQYFPQGGPASLALADPDFDGRLNLLEFALGSSPFVLDVPADVHPATSAVFSLTMDVPTSIADLGLLQVQYCDDLTFSLESNLTTVGSTQRTPGSQPGSARLFFAEPTTGHLRRFARLFVDLP